MYCSGLVIDKPQFNGIMMIKLNINVIGSIFSFFSCILFIIKIMRYTVNIIGTNQKNTPAPSGLRDNVLMMSLCNFPRPKK